jgi:DNA-binding FrmR family transcriptional regulator
LSFKRIEGQVRGLSRMIEEDRYCIDIVTQISAVRAALRRAEEPTASSMRSNPATAPSSAGRSPS